MFLLTCFLLDTRLKHGCKRIIYQRDGIRLSGINNRILQHSMKTAGVRMRMNLQFQIASALPPTAPESKKHPQPLYA